jgi:hypothetical protein
MPETEKEIFDLTQMRCCSMRNCAENMVLIAKCSSIILVIHNNMINVTNYIVEYVFIAISRSHGCNHNQS